MTQWLTPLLTGSAIQISATPPRGSKQAMPSTVSSISRQRAATMFLSTERWSWTGSPIKSYALSNFIPRLQKPWITPRLLAVQRHRCQVARERRQHAEQAQHVSRSGGFLNVRINEPDAQTRLALVRHIQGHDPCQRCRLPRITDASSLSSSVAALQQAREERHLARAAHEHRR